MQKLQFLTEKICLKHYSGPDHPEKPSRISHLLAAFSNIPHLIREFTPQSSKFADIDFITKAILSVHSQKLFNMLQATTRHKKTFFDLDCIANNHTYQAVISSIKLALIAAHEATPAKSFFALIRPPGHHATHSQVMGFCYLNNMAVAAATLVHQKKKVAIIDFDFHYGNGTAEIFWKTPDVLYVSIHADPSINFPYSGFIDEIGEGDGRGFNICVPMSFGAGDQELIEAFREIIIPLLEEFNPTVIGMSSGFDGFSKDPVGRGFLRYSAGGYYFIGQSLANYVNEKSIPAFHVLEGGYNVSKLPLLVKSYAAPWVNPFLQELQHSDSNIFQHQNVKVKQKEKKTFEYLKHILQPYWNLKS